MNIKTYHQQYIDFINNFEPANYGFTLDELESGKIDLYSEWVDANYAGSTREYLYENRERVCHGE